MTTHATRRRAPQFELAAGVLCLDFVNTLDNRPSDQPKELLNSYMDVARFAEDTGILTPSQADDLVHRSEKDSRAAQRILQSAIELREAMFAVFHAIMNKEPVPAPALAQLNEHVQEAASHLHLVTTNRHFEWRFDDSSSLESILWPMARSVAELLASDQLKFVRACGLKTCQWFFLDTSKNHRRRWCQMDICGNRAKARRFYARKKKQ